VLPRSRVRQRRHPRRPSYPGDTRPQTPQRAPLRRFSSARTTRIPASRSTSTTRRLNPGAVPYSVLAHADPPYEARSSTNRDRIRGGVRPNSTQPARDPHERQEQSVHRRPQPSPPQATAWPGADLRVLRDASQPPPPRSGPPASGGDQRRGREHRAACCGFRVSRYGP